LALQDVQSFGVLLESGMSSSATTRERLPLLRAYPHRWGLGMVHQINPHDEGRTLCGKTLKHCPGDKFDGAVDLITCKVCLRSRDTHARMDEWEKKYAEQREMNYDERQRQWQSDYREYLSSQIWLGKRARVLQRANDMCEGCGCRRAWQVHHLRYPRSCRPGSDDWIRQEKLFDLRAICRECHEDVHQR
jgi:hypothetical protein